LEEETFTNKPLLPLLQTLPEGAFSDSYSPEPEQAQSEEHFFISLFLLQEPSQTQSPAEPQTSPGTFSSQSSAAPQADSQVGGLMG